ncbi:MAG: hypothetical protein AB7I52_10975 [Rhizobiaceae bacterium]
MRFVIVFMFMLLGVMEGQAAQVSKSQREAIIFVTNLSQGNSLESAFYDVVEFGAAVLAQGALSPVYRNVFTIQGNGATLSALRLNLNTMTAKPSVRAVDLIFVTHGLSDRVLFADGRRTMNEVRDAILSDLSPEQRAKLRMLFSTACFGATHRAKWREAGFRVVSGSEGIYADSALSYPAFLGAWVAGQSFRNAIGIANGIDPLRLNDNAAKAWFESKNKRDLANQVNSNRVITGSNGLTLGSI